jgi:hypothetical protein
MKDGRRGARRLKWTPAVVIVTVLAVAGVALAATGAFYFLAPQTGTYHGPGLPISKSIDVNLSSDGSYYALGVHFNDTVSAAWLNLSGYGTGTGDFGFMNQSQFGSFTNDSGIGWLVEYTLFGSLLDSYHASLAETGPTIYAVVLATSANSTFDATLTVTALA